MIANIATFTGSTKFFVDFGSYALGLYNIKSRCDHTIIIV